MIINSSRRRAPVSRFVVSLVALAMLVAVATAVLPAPHARAATSQSPWRIVATSPAGHWQTVTHVGGLFVALGDGALVAVSHDGVTWSDHRVPAGDWQTVAYGNGRFIALSSASAASHEVISSDGVTWTALPGPTGAWAALTYGAGRFVAVGADGQVTTTIDGVHWTTTWVHSKFHFTAIAYGNGRFIAVDNTMGDDIISLNGLSWSFYRIFAPSQRWDALSFGDGNFVAFDNARRDIVATTVLGYTWTTHVTARSQDVNASTYGCDRFVAVGHSPVASGAFFTSPTGTAWTSAAMLSDATAPWTSVAYGAFRFVAVDRAGTIASMRVVAPCDHQTPTPPRDVSGNIPSAGRVWIFQHPPASAGGAPVDGYLVTITDGTTTTTCHAAVFYQPNCIISGLRDRRIYQVTTQAHNRFGYSVPSDPQWVIPVASWQFTATALAPVASASQPLLVEVTGVLANAEGIYPENWMTIHVGARLYYCQPSWFGECYVRVAHPALGRTAIYATYTGYGRYHQSPTTYVTIVP